MNRAVDLLLKMEPQLKAAGFNDNTFKRLRENLLDSHYELLLDIEIYEYREVVEIRRLLSEELWASYEMVGLEATREQLMLHRAYNNLKIAMTRKVSKVVKKKPGNWQEISSSTRVGVGVQSDGAGSVEDIS